MYSFTDIERTLYTVTNVPDAIHIPDGVAVNVVETASWADMQRPHGLGLEVPEAPYLLRGTAPNDVLLSRLTASMAAKEFNFRFATGIKRQGSFLVTKHRGLLGKAPVCA